MNVRVVSKSSGRILPIYLYDAGYQRIRMDETCEWPFYQIVCCYQGTGNIEIGGRMQPLRPGTLLFIPPGTEHTYYAGPKPYYVSWVSFLGQLVQSLPAYYGLSDPSLSVVIDNVHHPDLHLQIMSVMEVVDLSDSAERISVLLYGIITEFLLRLRFDGDSGEAKASYRKVDAVIRWMWNHLHQPADIGELARLFQVSRQHLNRMFQTRHGTSTKDFFIKLKILQAQKDLLHYPYRDIQEIASGLGFVNASHFARVFRKLTGASPSRFREADSSKQLLSAEDRAVFYEFEKLP